MTFLLGIWHVVTGKSSVRRKGYVIQVVLTMAVGLPLSKRSTVRSWVSSESSVGVPKADDDAVAWKV